MTNKLPPYLTLVANNCHNYNEIIQCTHHSLNVNDTLRISSLSREINTDCYESRH